MHVCIPCVCSAYEAKGLLGPLEVQSHVEDSAEPRLSLMYGEGTMAL